MEHVVLLRGINVGGNNPVPMARLREVLSAHFTDVQTYLQSGNVVLTSPLPSTDVARTVESLLPEHFALTSSTVRVLALDAPAYRQAVAQAPDGFGEDPETFRYDVGFYVGVEADDVRPHVAVHPDVDVVHFGEHAFYHRRLVALASRSRMSKIASTPVYRALTIRNWRTTTTLAGMLTDQ